MTPNNIYERANLTFLKHARFISMFFTFFFFFFFLGDFMILNYIY